MLWTITVALYKQLQWQLSWRHIFYVRDQPAWLPLTKNTGSPCSTSFSLFPGQLPRWLTHSSQQFDFSCYSHRGHLPQVVPTISLFIDPGIHHTPTPCSPTTCCNDTTPSSFHMIHWKSLSKWTLIVGFRNAFGIYCWLMASFVFLPMLKLLPCINAILSDFLRVVALL